MKIDDLKFDCRHFLGHIPCRPNKLYDVTCDNCTHYEASLENKSIDTKNYFKEIFQICNFEYKQNQPLSKDFLPIQKKEGITKILFIKLGAIGDVIRTTPLLTKYIEIYKNCHFTWITHSPQVLPEEKIDKIYKWNEQSLYAIGKDSFDIAINLDKDQEACMLLSHVNANKKFGFLWKENHIDIATEKAEHKLITGLFDHLSKTNTKNYLEEIFEICHFKFNKEEYMVNLDINLSDKWHKKLSSIVNGKTIIGLNTGCGERWQTRLWPKQYWIKLINSLQDQGYFCLLMGGPQEDEMNQYYAKQTQATYFGYFSLEEFISITNNVEIIVTPVSMMMHIALALKKQLMLFHNIFNIHEFELYNRGIIIEPSSGCDCYFGNTCSREKSCMHDISVQDVLTNIVHLNKNLKI